jgi:hypothetical protein
MPSELAPAEQPSFVGSDEDVDAVIDLCGGDPREAVRTLIVAYATLEQALERAHHQASHGYVRGRYAEPG